MSAGQTESPRALMIGLDAADVVLIEQWMADGTLPNLQALAASGVFGPLATTAAVLAGSPWPTFYSGQTPAQHGVYADYQWQHERLRFARPSAEWLATTGFWRHLEGDVPALVYDCPMVLGVEPFKGTEVAAWATHDALTPPASHPAELAGEIARRFGQWHTTPEAYGPSSIDTLLSLRQELLENTRRSTELVLWLMQRPWRLGLVTFSALHRGGHRLFDRSSVTGPMSPADADTFDGALRDLYRSCDAAVGRLVAAAPDATIVVFALHGMMRNTARVDLFDGMLERITTPSSGPPKRAGLARRMGEAIPLDLRRSLTKRIPIAFRNRLMTMWTTGGMKWDTTSVFPLRADLQGYARINLAGREPKGIVEPGPALDELCERIIEGLHSFRDTDTGDELVDDVLRTDTYFPQGGRRDRLPDLIVRWKDTPAATHASVRSPRYGVVQRTMPGRVPNGRSGNHRGTGFFIARGSGMPAGLRAGEASILDLVPSVLHRLRVISRLPLGGAPIPALVTGT
jgi:predicted AlkP superfamily phosphohydrolase/phosphomutase